MHEKFPAPPHIIERRERVFLILAGLFLGTLAMLNILGISRFIKLYEIVFHKDTSDQWSLVFAVAVGVLPYPLTFLCTDLISEFYGRSRANWVVFVGLLLNLWVVAILLIGGWLPGFGGEFDQYGNMVRDAAGRLPVFFEIRKMTLAAVGASMLAYLSAQYVDVYLYHFWMKFTKGKHLWLRNNGSTLVSQLVDTVAVILITYFTFNVFDPDSGAGLPLDKSQSVIFQLVVSFIFAGYVFKAFAALLDTIPMYIASSFLRNYLQMDPSLAYADTDES